MKISKKLAVGAMAALFVAVSVIPSAFSWYPHSGTESGNSIKYRRQDLPLSAKSASNAITVSTKLADANGEESGSAISGGISVAARSSSEKQNIQYYVTTLRNTGSNDVYADLELSELPNNADVSIGTYSPTLNEKAYASRPARSKKSHTSTRVYFKTHSSWSSFWGVDNGSLETTHDQGSNTSTNDINIAYKAESATKNFKSPTSSDSNKDETIAKMTKCTNGDTAHEYNSTNNVYYFDLPADTEYFYFFNHWYLKSASNWEWNRTVNISDMSPGRLYYLNGEIFDSKYKDYSVSDINTDLLAVMEYYDSVRMSLGESVFADISLKKESEDESDEFTPDYYGASITYTSNNTARFTINKDGVITPKASGTGTITTLITGKFGDTVNLTTNVSIPTQIDQYPIAQNIKLGAAGSKDAEGKPTDEVKVYWYVENRSSDSAATAASIFVTL